MYTKNVFTPWSNSWSPLHPRSYEGEGTCDGCGTSPQLREGGPVAFQPPCSAPGARAAGGEGDCEKRTRSPLAKRTALQNGSGGRRPRPAPSARSPGSVASPDKCWRMREAVSTGMRLGDPCFHFGAELHIRTPPALEKSPWTWSDQEWRNVRSEMLRKLESVPRW